MLRYYYTKFNVLNYIAQTLCQGLLWPFNKLTEISNNAWPTTVLWALGNFICTLIKAPVCFFSDVVFAILLIPTKPILTLHLLLAAVVNLVLLPFIGLTVFVQVLLFITPKLQPLTIAEKQMVYQVFGKGLYVGNVRIIRGFGGINSLSATPNALGNIIFLKDENSNGLLVHECVHVWQYQQGGPSYMLRSLLAQWLLPNAYNWQAELDKGKQRWVDFNVESQAQYIQDRFDGKTNLDFANLVSNSLKVFKS